MSQTLEQAQQAAAKAQAKLAALQAAEDARRQARRRAALEAFLNGWDTTLREAQEGHHAALRAFDTAVATEPATAPARYFELAGAKGRLHSLYMLVSNAAYELGVETLPHGRPIPQIPQRTTELLPYSVAFDAAMQRAASGRLGDVEDAEMTDFQSWGASDGE